MKAERRSRTFLLKEAANMLLTRRLRRLRDSRPPLYVRRRWRENDLE